MLEKYLIYLNQTPIDIRIRGNGSTPRTDITCPEGDIYDVDWGGDNNQQRTKNLSAEHPQKQPQPTLKEHSTNPEKFLG